MAKSPINKTSKPFVPSSPAIKTMNPSISKEDLHGLIAKKAFELFEKRGKKPGHAMDDWLEAERIVKGNYGSKK